MLLYRVVDFYYISVKFDKITLSDGCDDKSLLQTNK